MKMRVVQKRTEILLLGIKYIIARSMMQCAQKENS